MKIIDYSILVGFSLLSFLCVMPFALSGYADTHALSYVEAYTSGPYACDGDLSLSIIIHNPDDAEQEAFFVLTQPDLGVHLVSEPLSFLEDAFVPVHFVVPLKSEDIKGGTYEFEIQIHGSEEITRYFKMVTLEQCPQNADISAVINSYSSYADFSSFTQPADVESQLHGEGISFWVLLPLVLVIIIALLATFYLFLQFF